MKQTKKFSLKELRLVSFTTSEVKGGNLPNPGSFTFEWVFTCKIGGGDCAISYTGCDGDNYCP